MDLTHTQTNKKAVSQYNKCNQLPPVLSSKDRLIKEPMDFTCCEEVRLRIFSILSISFNVLILDKYRRSSRKAVLNLSLIVQYKKKCASSSTTPHFSQSLKCLGILYIYISQQVRLTHFGLDCLIKSGYRKEENL